MERTEQRTLGFASRGCTAFRRCSARLRSYQLLNRILVIRGGAIGDFVLTLPAIKLLRDAFPLARIEILGYKHIVALAEKRFYAEAVRSIEYGALASFFARGAELPNELSEYFASFDLILSYLFDPDGIFAGNLQRCRVSQLLTGPAKLHLREHAALQLARPLEQVGLVRPNPAAEIFPSVADHIAAAHLLASGEQRLIAFHPGSGSTTKNWTLEKWAELGFRLAVEARLVVVAGEADTTVLTHLKIKWADLEVRYVEHQLLPVVAAVLARAHHFVGHDSGISHIAGAVGTPCHLLFGPTDPKIWAPANPRVVVLRGVHGTMDEIAVEQVSDAVNSATSS